MYLKLKNAAFRKVFNIYLLLFKDVFGKTEKKEKKEIKLYRNSKDEKRKIHPFIGGNKF